MAGYGFHGITIQVCCYFAKKPKAKYINFIFVYRDSGTYKLSAVDDIQILLDDQIIKTQTMKSSPYIKPFEEDIL